MCKPEQSNRRGSAEVDTNRLLRRFDEMAAIGSTGDGGVHRLAGSASDGAARDRLRSWFAEIGLRTIVDPVGSMAGVLDLAGPDAPVIMAGSHLDSQPHGGRFDGALGVVAACEAASVLREAAQAGAMSPRCNLAVVNWTSEEGARFQPSLLGSAVFTGSIETAAALAQRDGDGVTLGEALQAIGYAGSGALPRPAAYVELHIECASALDQAEAGLGLFTRFWGSSKYRIEFQGEQAHTGPTPMAARKDALLGAAYLIAALREMAVTAPGVLHTSVGRIEVSPNSPNVVPAGAVLFVELRSADPAVLTWAEATLAQCAPVAAARAQVGIAWRGVERRPAGEFDARLLALCAEEAAGWSGAVPELASVPGHDAVSLARICPSAMLVARSVGGVCHHPNEFTAPEDVVLGTQALTRVLWRLCEQGVA